MRFVVVLCALMFCFSCCMVVSADNSSVASFNEGEFSGLQVGDVFNVTLYVELNDLADTIAFGSISVPGIMWDGGVLDCINFTKGDIFDSTIFWMTPSIDNVEGWIDELVWGGPSEGSDNDGVYGVITFEVVGEGSTYIHIADFGVARAGVPLSVDIGNGVSINGGEPPDEDEEPPDNDDTPPNGGGGGGIPPVNPDEDETDENSQNDTDDPDDNSTDTPDNGQNDTELSDDENNTDNPDDNSTDTPDEDDDNPGWNWNNSDNTDDQETTVVDNSDSNQTLYVAMISLVFALLIIAFFLYSKRHKKPEEKEEKEKENEEYILDDTGEEEKDDDIFKE